MKRIMGTIKKRGTSPGVSPSSRNSALPQGDSPEAIIVREVIAFCESGAPNSQNAGDEFLHLPAIVDNAESSPAAAKEAAACIQRYLSKENYQRGFAQYNAIMLARILTDNPARLFTQNFDRHFVSTVKELLRDGKDMSVQQILRETLDYFEAEKVKENDTLMPLVEMWRKEKSKSARIYGNFANGPRNLQAPPFNQYQNQSRQGHSRGLPPPDELAARIEEAKTTARLLLQTIQSTPSSELLANDLVKEFAERASSAHRSIQQYMNSENPHPDADTMLTLIETNEQLNIAMSKHQRAVLQARKEMGVATPSPQTQAPPGQNAYFAPQFQPGQNVYGPPPMQNRYSQPQQPAENTYGQPAPLQQNAYNQPHQPQRDSYNQASPNSPNMYDGPSSPPRETSENFRPPSGPPPGARGAVRSQDFRYSASPPPPPLPSRNRPNSENMSSTQDYLISENHFSDDAVQPPPRNGDTGHEQPSQHDSQRPPVPYGGTPSYMNRQDSATNNITMHGASPTPEPPSAESGSPVSPLVADTRAIQARMGNLHV